ncbi:sulfur carrier protein ThiS [Williamsia deligens]|uniref:Sulfur carrier protein ThiS n=1 Tax=Williamsia deligens TaxID=321325 RepID=A0ABW3G5V8_9NOCA|nr:sulfur carrier protein ThiS [Williamsia deligens]MCP2193191.1 sulfur carrier protein [Williamsia deligens]
MITVTVNGTDHDVDDDISVSDLLRVLDLPDQGVAVAVDGSVRPRSTWEDGVSAGARVEVLTAVQGG